MLDQMTEVPWVIKEPSEANPDDTFVSEESANGIGEAVSTTNIAGKNHGTIIDNEVQTRALAVGQSTLGWGDL